MTKKPKAAATPKDTKAKDPVVAPVTPKEPLQTVDAAKRPQPKAPAGVPPNISNMFGGKNGKGPRFTPVKGRNFRHQGR